MLKALVQRYVCDDLLAALQSQAEIFDSENTRLQKDVLYINWDVEVCVLTHRGSTGPAEYFPEQHTSQYGRQ